MIPHRAASHTQLLSLLVDWIYGEILPMQYHTCAQVYADKVQKNKSALACTYRQNRHQPKGEFFLFVFFQGTVKMVDVNSALRFFEGYETLLAFDNQKTVFLFRDIWSL